MLKNFLPLLFTWAMMSLLVVILFKIDLWTAGGKQIPLPDRRKSLSKGARSDDDVIRLPIPEVIDGETSAAKDSKAYPARAALSGDLDDFMEIPVPSVRDSDDPAALKRQSQ
eukprot:TRINITY_DN6601_c0_g2_i1.p1 TRINITY_DN6601_c0_g2~~TRINITY_DN6601_c0_g2_i1.p1  ORF type:complete len:112 (+),score=7.53 TRINITY_DN6601_c0_g2_i1:70-405(+)